MLFFCFVAVTATYSEIPKEKTKIEKETKVFQKEAVNVLNFSIETAFQSVIPVEYQLIEHFKSDSLKLFKPVDLPQKYWQGVDKQYNFRLKNKAILNKHPLVSRYNYQALINNGRTVVFSL